MKAKASSYKKHHHTTSLYEGHICAVSIIIHQQATIYVTAIGDRGRGYLSEERLSSCVHCNLGTMNNPEPLTKQICQNLQNMQLL